MAAMSEIEKQVREFAEARTVLRDRVTILEDETTALKKRYLTGIRKAVEAAKEKQERLRASIQENTGLFEKPKTLVLFGIEFGFRKQKGKIAWEKGKDGVIVKLIKKYFPETWETYVKRTEKPLKPALGTLSVADLKRIGVETTDAGDAPYIKPVDGEVDKLVEKLLNEKEEDEEE